MDKIKAFFANTITVELVGAIVAAVAALVAFIAERVKKSE